MYAVIETGGKQYRVELGSEIEVELLAVDAGETIQLDRVLLVADGDETAIGRPLVDGAHVSASVVRRDRGEKIVVFKYKPKARRRVKKGHRQDLTVLRIADIALGERSAAQEALALAAEQEAAREAAAEEAARRAEADKALADQLQAEAVAPATETAAKPAPRRARLSVRSAAKPAAKSADTETKPAGKSTASRTQAGEPGSGTQTPKKRTPKKDE